LNFILPDRVWFYQGAYSEEYRKYYPGGVLHFCAIRHACQAGLSEYDFLRGDEPYKAEWTNGQRSLRYLAIIPDTLPGHLAFNTLVVPRWHLRSSGPANSIYQSWLRLRERFKSHSRLIRAIIGFLGG